MIWYVGCRYMAWQACKEWPKASKSRSAAAPGGDPTEFKGLACPWWFKLCGGEGIGVIQAAVAGGDSVATFSDETSEQLSKLCRLVVALC